MRISYATAVLIGMTSFTNADDCGGTNTCGSDFSSMSCSGQCCHDDFNAWCCPTDDSSIWDCNPTFEHDTSHCSAPLSCTCNDQKGYIISVKATGPATVVSSGSINTTACCAAGAANCGPTTTVSFTSTQETSWSATESWSYSLSTKETIIVAEMTETITLSGSYTQGGSTTRTSSVSVTVPCQAPSSGFTQESFVASKSSTQKLQVPVEYQIKQCGGYVTKTGTIKADVIKSDWGCSIDPCSTGQCVIGQGCSASFLA